MSSLKGAHFVLIHYQAWLPQAILVSDWPIKKIFSAMLGNGSKQNVHLLERTFHRCFLPSFGSFGQAFSEEKIKKNLYRDNCILNTDIYI
jgi:hypothetical protein